MKYKTRIEENNGTYVGYAISGETTVYTTNNHSDPVMVTRELSKFLASNPQPIIPKPQTRSSNIQQVESNNALPIRSSLIQQPKQAESVAPIYTPTVSIPPRKCCGRG